MTDTRLPVILYHREPDTPAHLGVGESGPLCGAPEPVAEEGAMLIPDIILAPEWRIPFCPDCVRLLRERAREEASGG
jgi:hypothetical protein